jgi:hypothetical protein
VIAIRCLLLPFGRGGVTTKRILVADAASNIRNGSHSCIKDTPSSKSQKAEQSPKNWPRLILVSSTQYWGEYGGGVVDPYSWPLVWRKAGALHVHMLADI